MILLIDRSIDLEYLEHRDCINATKSLMDVCNDDVIGDTQKILKAKKDNWIPLSCCFNNKTSTK
ncbi:hypothetical protein QR98_0056820 [Sarcoptes scabiei]|uniref:Uncharacterized protein n=1 Tax=Sarcoptes scabiei TaxID=52283 RepID=A0A132A9C0_SARSC|nr:hypothetical protein QR98_0056820 [Sarcoptes scabiei]